MLDVAGQDADEFFEDIGHSNEARKEMKKYLIGNFKLDEKALAAMKEAAEKKKNARSSNNTGLLLIVLIAIAAVLFRVYQSQTK
jgi:cytochrome b5